MAERLAVGWMTVDGVVTEAAGRGYVVTAKTVREWCVKGLFPGAVRWPDGWRIPKSGFNAFLETRTKS